MDSNKAVERFNIVYPESVEDSVKVLDIHGVLFLFRIVKLESWYPLPWLLV